MRAGEYRDRLTFQNPVTDVDSYGSGGDITWVDMATVYGSIKHLIGREASNIRMTFAEASHRIELRHISGVTPITRIISGDRIFDILEVNQDKRSIGELTIIAREKL